MTLIVLAEHRVHCYNYPHRRPNVDSRRSLLTLADSNHDTEEPWTSYPGAGCVRR
jgi:hypothetical protein